MVCLTFLCNITKKYIKFLASYDIFMYICNIFNVFECKDKKSIANMQIK
nr:MAG TPA: hypothetical protein [Bacteriophage sp.]